MHSTTIANYMDILELSGIIKTVEADEKCVYITKKKHIDNDPLYYAIPEGTFSIKELMIALKVKREQVFQVLKKYEGNLVFIFTPPKCLHYWKLMSEFNIERINNVFNKLITDSQIIDSINIDCQKLVNDMVQNFCQQNKKEAVFIPQGIKTASEILSI